MPLTTPPLEFWFMALHEPVGIVVQSNNRHLLMNKLYAARKEYGDSQEGENELMALSICASPTNDTELWIVHKKVTIEPEKKVEAR